MRPIAIRLFENKKLGTTYAPGLRRNALFNATAEINQPYAKYLLDFEDGRSWINHARTDDQLAIARKFIDQVEQADTILWSWVKWYDKGTGDKEYVAGFAAYDTDTEEVAFHLNDPKRDLNEEWFLPVRRCQATAGRNSPTFLATNHDLA